MLSHQLKLRQSAFSVPCLRISAQALSSTSFLLCTTSLYSSRRFIALGWSVAAHVPVLHPETLPQKPSPTHDGKSNSSRLARVAGSTIQIQHLPELFDIEGLNERPNFTSSTPADPWNPQLSSTQATPRLRVAHARNIYHITNAGQTDAIFEFANPYATATP